MALRFTTGFLFVSSLSLLVVTAHAQSGFSIGPRLGLNVSTYHFSESNAAFRREYRPGVEAGLMASISFGHLALQPALLYSQKGFTEQTSVDVRTGTNLPIGTGELTYSNRLHYLTLPINVAYTQHSDGQGMQVFAGPYLGLLMSGKYESTTDVASSSTTESGQITPVFNDAPDLGSYARRLDAGLQAGVGYRYHALLLQGNYSMGLRDVAARYTYNGLPVSSTAYYNRAFQVALTYMVGPAK